MKWFLMTAIEEHAHRKWPNCVLFDKTEHETLHAYYTLYEVHLRYRAIMDLTFGDHMRTWNSISANMLNVKTA